MTLEDELTTLPQTDSVHISAIFQLTFYNKETEICKCYTFNDEVFKLVKEHLNPDLAQRLDEVILDVNTCLWKQSGIYAEQKGESEPILWYTGVRTPS